ILTKMEWLKQLSEMFDEVDYTCQICGRQFQADAHCLCGHHIKTRGAGGGDEAENIKILCKSCHHDVHNGLIKINS
ncbi:MAG: HNH endonuclease signature motif containing protein, partial [Candidatus Cloacimonadota bacterium]|nr:HNH endonuclease signature motif containing protein [Candidatus Cloacimonadota bacterium]